jgi:molybdopterin molybdotransferase
MLTPAAATELILKHIAVLPPEILPLVRSVGRVLRQEVHGERDQPPFHRVTMDGIAFASSPADQAQGEIRRSFPILGVQAAGAPPLTLAQPEGCIEVMTGAVLPAGCDCVIPVEKLTITGGVAEVAGTLTPAPWMNVQKQGWDSRAGQLLLSPGVRLDATHVAVLASAGLAAVQVTRLPRILVITTGDELIEPGLPIKPWQIRRSNAYAILAALQKAGYADVDNAHLQDEPSSMLTKLQGYLDTYDVLILSGGVSMGRFDYVPQSLSALGVRQIFHKISQRPGLPMWFGTREDGKAAYALPGNPVSTLVCLLRYVVPGLHAALGLPPAAPRLLALGEDFEVKPPLTYFLPVIVEAGDRGPGVASGSVVAAPKPTKGSGDFISLLGTQGFVELAPGPRTVPSGTVVPFYEW